MEKRCKICEGKLCVPPLELSKPKNIDLQKEANAQKAKIIQNNNNQKELEFLRLNLIYSSKCLRTVFRVGYKVGTPEYRACILRRGKKLND